MCSYYFHSYWPEGRCSGWNGFSAICWSCRCRNFWDRPAEASVKQLKDTAHPESLPQKAGSEGWPGKAAQGPWRPVPGWGPSGAAGREELKVRDSEHTSAQKSVVLQRRKWGKQLTSSLTFLGLVPKANIIIIVRSTFLRRKTPKDSEVKTFWKLQSTI